MSEEKDNKDADNINSEINLNLKIPPDDSDGSFSFKDLVLTVYNSRKIFLAWTIIGMVLGIVAAGGMYYLQTRQSGGETDIDAEMLAEVSASVIVSYSKPSDDNLATGSGFDVSLLYVPEIWENALRAIGRDDMTAADAMLEVSIANTKFLDNLGGLLDAVTNTLAGLPQNMQQIILQNLLSGTYNGSAERSTFLITIPADNFVFNGTEEKEAFLLAFCAELEEFVVSSFYEDKTVEILQELNCSDWTILTAESVNLDNFDFNANFGLLRNRYEAMEEVFARLYEENPLYVSSEGKRFDEYAFELREVVGNDIVQWINKTDRAVYIRNIDQFINEYDTTRAMNIVNYNYYLELLTLYNETMYSYRQGVDSQNADSEQSAGEQESLDLFRDTQAIAELAAELNQRISRMEYLYEAVFEDETAIRARSRDAESALNGLIADLDDTQTLLRSVVSEFYMQRIESDAGAIILYTEPTVTDVTEFAPVSGGVLGTRSLIMLAFVFIVCVAAGIVMAFLVVAVKKHLPPNP